MKKIILSIVALSALASCQKSEELSSAVETQVAVSFTSEVSTRVSDTTWETGDEIGVFMYEKSDSEINDRYGTNVLYYISSGAETTSAKFTSDDPLYFPQNGSMDFVAYYPFVAGTANGEPFAVGSSDQSSEAKLNALDFMVARAADCSEGSSPTLVFDRKMSKIVFNVNIKDTAAGLALSDFTLSNVVSGGTYTITNMSAAIYTAVIASTTKESISLFISDSDEVEAIVVPQSATDAKIAVTVGGNTYSGTFSETFEAGMQYIYTLTIGIDTVEFGGATITPWGEFVDNGDLAFADDATLAASEIDADHVPAFDTWTITDAGEITQELMAGVRAALEVVKEESRSIKIIMPNATSIGDNAFSYNTQGEYNSECYALTEIELPDVTTIGEYAFRYCGLTSFDFEGVTEVEPYAFACCTQLTEVTNISFTSIPESLFLECSSLTSFDFEGVTEIGVVAFAFCSNLTKIELPSSVTSIGIMAFCYSGVTTVTLNWRDSNILTYSSSADMWFEGAPLETIYIPAGTKSDYVSKGWTESLLTEVD